MPLQQSAFTVQLKAGALQARQRLEAPQLPLTHCEPVVQDAPVPRRGVGDGAAKPTGKDMHNGATPPLEVVQEANPFATMIASMLTSRPQAASTPPGPGGT